MRVLLSAAELVFLEVILVNVAAGCRPTAGPLGLRQARQRAARDVRLAEFSFHGHGLPL